MFTLNGQPAKRIYMMKKGDTGHVPAERNPGAATDVNQLVCPSMTPAMGDCYLVTIGDDQNIDLQFVAAVTPQPRSWLARLWRWIKE